MDFYITDVFAQEKYSGNQLATFLHCSDLSGRERESFEVDHPVGERRDCGGGNSVHRRH